MKVYNLMSEETKQKLSKILFGVYTLIVLLLSLLPSFIFMHMPYMPSFSFADKLAHFLMYCFYTLITGYMLGINKSKYGILSFPILYTVMFGVAMEFFQMLLRGAGRSSSFSDIIANVLGTLTGAALLIIIDRKYLRQTIQSQNAR